MSFMHFDAHTAAAGVSVPSLSGTSESPNTIYSIDNTDGVIAGYAVCSWIFGAADAVSGGGYFTEQGSITRFDSDFGAGAYSYYQQDTTWLSDKEYTGIYWIRATLDSGDAPDVGQALNTWHSLAPGTTPAPDWQWQAEGKFSAQSAGTLMIEIARDDGTGLAPGITIATGYYAGSATLTYKGGGGGGCFIAGTMVTMANGSEKAIEDIVAGDVVLALDSTTNVVRSNPIRPIGNKKLYSINGSPFYVTSEHPFMTPDGWKSISPTKTLREHTGSEFSKDNIHKLEVGDFVLTKNGEPVEIKSIRGNGGYQNDMPIYNLSVSGNQTYFANGFAVHNK